MNGEAGYATVLRLLGERVGLFIPPRHRGDLEACVARAMAGAGLSSVEAFATQLAEEGAWLDELIEDLTVGETYFMRDPRQLEVIRELVLPAILAARPEHAPINVWSVGCATGEEPYSLAMILQELDLLSRATLLGTDVSKRRLARARSGLYSKISFRQCRNDFRDRWFRPDGDRLQLISPIHGSVRFERHNLVSDPRPPTAMDLILCRNVLIYLDEPARAKAARQLYDALREGGWLITGATDPFLHRYAPFEVRVTSAGFACIRAAAGPAAARPPSVSRGRPDGVPESLATPRPKPALAVPSPPTPAPRSLATPRPISAAPSPPAAPTNDPACLAAAEAAMARGDWAVAAALTADRLHVPEAAALQVRALTNAGRTVDAERAARAAVARHPLDPELRFLLGMLLVAIGAFEDALAELRGVVYLDRELAAAHLVVGQICLRLGNAATARRAFRNARDASARRPPEQPLPLAEGRTARELFEAAAQALDRLGGEP